MKKRLTAILCVFLLFLGLLAGCGSSGGAEAPAPEGPAAEAQAAEAAPAETEAEAPAEAPAAEAPASGTTGEGAKVAGAADMAAPVELDLEGLTPLGPEALREGVYAVDVDCSSSMFKIVSCLLTVGEGGMTAVMTMSGTAYLYLYMGTGEEAAAASESDYIPFGEDADGAHTFTVPVEALDAPIACAAFSKNKEMWYDRTLVFRSDSLPLDAFGEGQLVTAADLGLADGEYTVEVALEGGSGRASVTSPARLTVTGGEATAVIEWSSSNYDYMKVDDVKYEPVNLEGNSVFEIPVAGFDFRLPVLADTTAMSTPHEIEYTLRFDAGSLQSAVEK